MVEILKIINIGLSFILELVMLAAFGYWGFYGDKSTLLKWALGIGIPVLAAVVWSLWLAPRATYRLNMTMGSLFSLLLFLLAATALFYTPYRTLAIVFAGIAVLNRGLILIWKQW